MSKFQLKCNIDSLSELCNSLRRSSVFIIKLSPRKEGCYVLVVLHGTAMQISRYTQSA